MTTLATRFGRYGYRRITVLLRHEGWRVNHKRVERLWREEGLKGPAKQPKRGRLWFADGSIVRRRAQHRDHVWSYDFVFDRTAEALSELRPRRRAGDSWYLDQTYVKVAGHWCYLYRTIDRDGELLDSMLSEHRDKHAARRFLRRLVEVAEASLCASPRTSILRPAGRSAGSWGGRYCTGRTSTARHHGQASCVPQGDPLDPGEEGTAPDEPVLASSHRAVKQRYYPMLGVGSFESASQFCAAFDELLQYLRVRRRGEGHVSLAEQRRLFLTRWRSLISEIAVA